MAIDGLATSAISSGKVTTLAHEVGDHTMESGALEVERLARPADTLLTGAESTEVLSGLRNHISTEL